MDITPFIPIIVEATRFLLEKVSKWIDDFRQRDLQKSAPPVGTALPFPKEQFAKISPDPKRIAELLNETFTQADIEEIRILLEQLKKRRTLFLELESQEVTAAGPEAAKLRVQMQEESNRIVEIAKRLENMLSRVYRPRN